MSFANFITNALGDTYITLTPEEISFIQKTVKKSPHVFENLKSTINNIGINGYIGPENIPQLIMIIYNLYQDNFIDKDVNIDIINVTQFTVDILLEIATISPMEEDPIKHVTEYSFQLLRTNVPFIEKEETVVCNFLFDFFNDIFTSIGKLFSRIFSSKKEEE